jgi:hypothetical protein
LDAELARSWQTGAVQGMPLSLDADWHVESVREF